MCDFASFFIHSKAIDRPLPRDRYAIGDLRSHSKSAELLGISYGVKNDNWREAEWTDNNPKSLTVHGDDNGELKALILADFEDRNAFLLWAFKQIPNSVTTLYLSGATISANLTIPNSVTTLYLSGATIPANLTIPNSVTTLYLSYATISANLTIPNSVTTLDLYNATIPANLTIPNSVTTLYADGTNIPESVKISFGCKVYK